MTMSSPQPIAETAHRCASERRCSNKVDGKPRETEKPNTFCPSCLKRTQSRIEQLPEQWIRLHHMIGDRHAGVDVNIRRPKPGTSVPLNLHVDTLLGSILTDVTTAAEVVADKMNMDPPTEVRENPPEHPLEAPVWASSPKQELVEQVQRCARIVAPNIPVLINTKGYGGRDADDTAIDVMVWKLHGRWHMPATTTGVDLIKSLDHLGSLAFFTLGLTRARTQRDLPCSRCRARTVGRWAGSEYFDCSQCGSQFPEDDLRRQDKVLIELHRRGLLNPSVEP